MTSGGMALKEKLSFKQNMLIGSLLFGLFFGAGNLIFPVQMGQLAGSNTLQATIGFLITGVGLPILGIMASALTESDSLYDMGKPISTAYSIFFTSALYLTIGPLFAIPRTATVAFEVGIHPFISKGYLNIGLLIFSFIFFALTLYYSLRPGRILDWIGKYLTPVFVILLSILLIAVFVKPMGQINEFSPVGDYITKPLFIGLLEGYNTMDALASLAFAIIIITNIKELGVKDPRRITIEAGKSGIISAAGMAIIYTSLAYMGVTSLGSVSRADNGGIILSMVSNHYFGFIGQVLLAGIVGVACLKTAIGLITACSSIFSEMFPNSLSYNSYAKLFTLVSLAIANLGLNNIIQYSIPVLMFLYPLAISLIILALLNPILNKEQHVYRWTTGLIIIAAFFDFCKALPEPFKSSALVIKLVEFAHGYIPGFDYGFGWVLPGVIGFIVGLIIWKVNGNREYT